ncbi:MAG: DVUA0089 family protein [Chitinispirillaceae bacterium]|nr:DVUA0089 family protein [Chitinispirillaceae bacterium]
MMIKYLYTIICALLLTIKLFAWDRYSNEIEATVDEYVPATNIVRYYFDLSITTTCDFYTDNISEGGDTYMHLWNESQNVQVAKNDDASVPSGYPWASRITMSLPAGSYILFVRSYNQYSKGRCNLYRNGSIVISNVRFGGFLSACTWDYEGDRKRTTNLSSGGDTYCLLLDQNYNLVGYDDDDGDGLASSIMFPYTGLFYFVTGAYSEAKECTCDLTYTSDSNLEFISLCGPEVRHVESGTEFTTEFNYSHNPAYSTCVEANAWQFQGQRLSNTDWGIDNVDLLWIHSHGGWGGCEMRNGTFLDFTAPTSAVGSGDRTNNEVGDLEYLCVLACQTVRVEHKTSFTWLVNRGWMSTSTNKGLFDGLHVVVGYHSDHHNKDPLFKEPSWNFEARTFANKLEEGWGIWWAWIQTNQETEDEYSGWFSSFSPGMASVIGIWPQYNEKIADHRSDDIVFGMPEYTFGIAWYGDGDEPPD